MPMSDRGIPVHVVGAGPGGLAVAAALHERGVPAVVLEKSPDVGASWRGHYDRLRLHTTRRGSSLPGLDIPRSAGRWVARDDFVRYLESYTAHHRIEVATGVHVERLERAETGWTLFAGGGRRLNAPAVVVATGHNHTPHVPDWPGADDFPGELLHASDYRSAAPFAGRDVLVVGVGNTGAEIAADLAGGGAGRVRLSVRTPPHIVRRSTLGWPSQASGVLARRLPLRVADAVAARQARLSLPDLAPHGLPRPAKGLATRAAEGAIPVVDAGLVKAVRTRRVEVVAPVREFGPEGRVELTDGVGFRPDVVIAATGYRRGLEDLVGKLGVLDAAGRPLAHGPRTHPEAPDLYFLGYTTPLSGTLREIAREAPRVARAIARGVPAAR